MAYIQYPATEGQRWDSVAHECYADISLTGDIIRDNPEVPIKERLKGGTFLKIRIIEKKMTSTAKILPPWK